MSDCFFCLDPVKALTNSITEANAKSCFLCFCASVHRQEINKGRGDSGQALLFIELKASGMTGITVQIKLLIFPSVPQEAAQSAKCVL